MSFQSSKIETGVILKPEALFTVAKIELAAVLKPGVPTGRRQMHKIYTL